MMTRSDFRGADMTGVKLDNATVQDADLTGAVLDDVDFSQCLQGLSPSE
jgi:uncharacterized protein YjbI with pentapeptide repeats